MSARKLILAQIAGRMASFPDKLSGHKCNARTRARDKRDFHERRCRINDFMDFYRGPNLIRKIRASRGFPIQLVLPGNLRSRASA